MDTKAINIAEELKQRLSKTVNVLELKIYGSRIRDDYTEDSDLDIYILVPSTDSAVKQHIRDIVWEVSYKHEIMISSLIVAADDLNTALRSAPIMKTIEESGLAV